jgi:hypothetical protein
MGLATAIAELLRQSPVDHSLAYMRGARSRIEALAAGRADLAVVSRLAAEEALSSRDAGCEVLLALGAESYAGLHGWLRREGAAHWPPVPRIGVDSASADQSLAPRIAAQDGLEGVRFVELPYLRMQEAVAKGEVDAVFWPVDVEPRHAGLRLEPLALPRELSSAMSEAVLLIRQGDDAAKALLGNLLRSGDLQAIQQEVVAGTRDPSE